ncbi:translation factor Guf1, mitochondrial-like [Daphnia carinata]|uniref:translation factor Guf1, mitochondrial-like n=1 Tax=Daphnia carinata TaxID=120202 RepID=UPI00257A7EE3|nr:translation factor Guf1, mitochondrial-like [Daphnia carinata]
MWKSRSTYHALKICSRNYAKVVSWKKRVFLLPTTSCFHCHLQHYSSKPNSEIDLTLFPTERIRNFSIIAHIDHGKSTLADRLLELTGTIGKGSHEAQMLDRLQVERERGITVKAQTATLVYNYQGIDYLLNLIDTPGHVDFSFEVARSLAACQGVILLVDANQGVQAQTVANFFLAFSQNLAIVPVMNKIDLKNANPESVAIQMKNVFEFESEDILRISAKTGLNVDSVLQSIVERIPPPSHCDIAKPFRALLFDSWYDRYRGVIAVIAVIDGVIRSGDSVSAKHTGKSYEIKELGILRPNEVSLSCLQAGQVGYVVCNMRSSTEAKVGDTLFKKGLVEVEEVASFRQSKPMVFAGVYPMDQSETPALRSALEKLTLNDSSVTVAKESSAALGQGWRLGFLGLLHMEVFNQRLEQEYGAEVIVTVPSVPYKIRLHGEKNIKKYGERDIIVNNPAFFPDPNIIEQYFEPMVLGTIITPDIYMGPIMSLALDRRGVQVDSKNVDNSRVMMQFKFPLNEIAVDFYDALKSLSSGYASFDYEEDGFEASDIVKLHIMLNGEVVEELSTVVHASKARKYGKEICLRLQETIPRQMFQVAIQAAVGGKVVARENVAALRKDVTAKCYGGDISRRMKLLKRQAEGKKRMKSIANIELPRDTFIKVLKR